MALEAGSVDSLGNYLSMDCMARYIEDALPPPPTSPLDPSDQAAMTREKRKFLIGLAKGIIDYLKAHDADSFEITLTPAGSGLSAELEIT